ncbi:tyrosyl-DNA phosphodiesterase [Poronia punctata]|nr:tyrosyl-DNA phosphodiesterase [Poronia punctata]
MERNSIKRQHSQNDNDNDNKVNTDKQTSIASLSHPISPPKKKRARERVRLSSPFSLTWIKDLPKGDNVDAVSLKDLVGDPLIAELWDFNYLHDVDFLMKHLDADTRALTKVHVVHGFWKREDPNKLSLEEQAAQYENVTLHTAHMPEMFGTHHSKMLVLLRHDDTAQIVIHTANMIAKDWTNMTNGVWKSPLLPKLLQPRQHAAETDMAIGRGSRFKMDLLNYLGAYNTRRPVCSPLVRELEKFDFSIIRGALVASVPGRHDAEREPGASCWGWQALREALKNVPVQSGESDIVVQISSIATLGANDTWLQRTLFSSLSVSASSSGRLAPSSSSSLASASTESQPGYKIVFPTADEIRRSLDGYASGGSIHMKIQSAAQTKQLQYLRPFFYHWANDSEHGETIPISQEKIAASKTKKDAGRKRAAPHIKTYIRYGEKSIDWALLTSANISKQAWGEAMNKAGEVRVASWEIGVLVWPELLTGDDATKMVGTFKTDLPKEEDIPDGEGSPIVGLRIPYSMPLQKYKSSEVPWVATMSHSEPDWMGQAWPGY